MNEKIRNKNTNLFSEVTKNFRLCKVVDCGNRLIQAVQIKGI